MGKEKGALPTSLCEKFSQGVLFEKRGIALPPWRLCLCASPLAPLLLLPAWVAPLPPQEAPNGYPVTPRGGGCSAAFSRRGSRQPLDPPAALPAGWEPGPQVEAHPGGGRAGPGLGAARAGS